MVLCLDLPRCYAVPSSIYSVFNPHVVLFGMQACSRAPSSRDPFGGTVGEREYSTGTSFGEALTCLLHFPYQNALFYCYRLRVLILLLFVLALRKAPKWLKRPVGATFGFGGKLVSFAPKKAAPGAAAAGSEVLRRRNILNFVLRSFKYNAQAGSFVMHMKVSWGNRGLLLLLDPHPTFTHRGRAC